MTFTMRRRANLPNHRATLSTLLFITILASCRPPEKPVSKQEALAFAKKIEVAVIEHNQNFLDNVIDQKYFAIVVLRESHQLFNPGLSKQAKTVIEDLHVGQQIVSTTQKIGMFKLLRQYEKDSHQHLLFRYFADDADLNYYDFELTGGDQGVKADDLYVYSSGEELSDKITGSLLESGKDKSDEDKQNDRLIADANQYLKGGNPDEAYSYYDQLPDKLKKEKTQQKLHIEIANKLGDSDYRAAVNEYKSIYPDDPYIYITILRQGEKHLGDAVVLDALNRFETFLPSDPFLDFYRGIIYQRLNKPAESRLAFYRFHSHWPLFGPVIGELVTNQVQAGHPDSAALLVKEAQRLNNITPEQLAAIKKAFPAMRPYLN
jgi:hypothetical protein